MKKLLLTGLLGLSTVCVHAGLLLTPEQTKALQEIQVGFSQEITELKREYGTVFNGSIPDNQKFTNDVRVVTYMVGLNFVTAAVGMNAIVNNKTSLDKEDVFAGLTQLYSFGLNLYASLTNLAKSEGVWIRPEAQIIFEQLYVDSVKDSGHLLGLVVYSEFLVALKNAGVQENADQITQEQLESAITEVVDVISQQLISRLATAVAKKAGRTEITKEDKVAALHTFVNFFESCIKDASFEKSQPVAETKSVETEKATNNKATRTKKAPAPKKK